jgi:hypothetical protein
MTSLGLLQYSEINESSSINSNLTEIEKKRQARHNITIKKRPNIASNSVDQVAATDNSENVQNMLKLINNTNGYDNDDNSGLADFNPPPRAEVSSKTSPPPSASSASLLSSGRGNGPQQADIDYEKPTVVIQQNNNENPNDNLATAVKPRQYPMPLDSQEGFNSLPKTYASDYYKQYVPYFNQVSSQNNNNRDQLLEKLNYMIHLLEEQKDEKTGHVMEEVILYSFLGVFIIFIVDSFARAGKYTR